MFVATHRGDLHFLSRVRRRLRVLPKCEARRKRGMSSVSLASFHACGVRSRLFRTFIEATRGYPRKRKAQEGGRYSWSSPSLRGLLRGGFFFRRHRLLPPSPPSPLLQPPQFEPRGPKVRDTARK